MRGLFNSYLVGLLEVYSKNVIELVKQKEQLLNIREAYIPYHNKAPYSGLIVQSIKQKQHTPSHEEAEKIAEEYLSGASTYELASKYGCHRTTIGNTLKRQGIEISNHIEGRKYQTEEVIRQYVEENQTIKQIAKMYDVSESTIYKCLKRNHINTKKTRWDYEVS